MQQKPKPLQSIIIVVEREESAAKELFIAAYVISTRIPPHIIFISAKTKATTLLEFFLLSFTLLFITSDTKDLLIIVSALLHKATIF